MSSTDLLQAYGVWIAAAVLAITFLLIWLWPRRAARHLRKDLTAPQIKLAERRATERDDTLEIKHVHLDPEDTELDARWATLTHRQKEVALLATRGLSDEEIAIELGVTTHTVQSHLKETRRKLGIHSRYQLHDIVRQVGHIPD